MLGLAYSGQESQLTIGALCERLMAFAAQLRHCNLSHEWKQRQHSLASAQAMHQVGQCCCHCRIGGSSSVEEAAHRSYYISACRHCHFNSYFFRSCLLVGHVKHAAAKVKPPDACRCCSQIQNCVHFRNCSSFGRHLFANFLVYRKMLLNKLSS